MSIQIVDYSILEKENIGDEEVMNLFFQKKNPLVADDVREPFQNSNGSKINGNQQKIDNQMASIENNWKNHGIQHDQVELPEYFNGGEQENGPDDSWFYGPIQYEDVQEEEEEDVILLPQGAPEDGGVQQEEDVVLLPPQVVQDDVVVFPPPAIPFKGFPEEDGENGPDDSWLYGPIEYEGVPEEEEDVVLLPPQGIQDDVAVFQHPEIPDEVVHYQPQGVVFEDVQQEDVAFLPPQNVQYEPLIVHQPQEVQFVDVPIEIQQGIPAEPIIPQPRRRRGNATTYPEGVSPNIPTYSAMIILAILNSPLKKLTPTEITMFSLHHFPVLRYKLQQSVRSAFRNRIAHDNRIVRVGNGRTSENGDTGIYGLSNEETAREYARRSIETVYPGNQFYISMLNGTIGMPRPLFYTSIGFNHPKLAGPENSALFYHLIMCGQTPKPSDFQEIHHQKWVGMEPSHPFEPKPLTSAEMDVQNYPNWNKSEGHGQLTDGQKRRFVENVDKYFGIQISLFNNNYSDWQSPIFSTVLEKVIGVEQPVDAPVRMRNRYHPYSRR